MLIQDRAPNIKIYDGSSILIVCDQRALFLLPILLEYLICLGLRLIQC